jgi:hypothetical protein
MMDDKDKYRSEFESYPPYQVRYKKSTKYPTSHERFIVPWQMVEVKEYEKVK